MAIHGLTEEQFTALPAMSLYLPCDACSKQGEYGRLLRDIKDYALSDDGTVTSTASHTALYLCSWCHWEMTCRYSQLEKEAKQRKGKVLA